MSNKIATQRSFDGLCPIDAAVDELASSSDEDRGAIFTRREVVDFVLDLSGFKASKNLPSKRFLEPSFGHGGGDADTGVYSELDAMSGLKTFLAELGGHVASAVARHEGENDDDLFSRLAEM